MRTINFRVWTGKKIFYQNSQYLGSFVRRAVQQICIDTNGSFHEHESYLPNGGNIDEYLMQYTGLKDKNGVGIYEGDILAYDGKSSGWHHKPGIVYYDLPNQQYRLAIADCNNDTLKAVVKAMDNSKSFSSYRMEAKHRVIIGNIYENQELINKQ